MIDVRRREYVFNCYNTCSELYNDLKNKKRRPTADDESETGNPGFCGTRSLDEAWDLFLHGDEKLYNEIKEKAKKIDISKLLGNVIKRSSTYNDVVGFQANVPNFLLGIPTDMIATVPNKKSQKILNIVINGAVSCGISTSEIETAGSYYYIVIDLLEKAGYRCNVYVTCGFRESGDEGYLVLRAKTDREPFNKEKMAFLLANPSFHRRINFKFIETCDCRCEPTSFGYGSPVTDNNHVKKIFEKELNANFIVWSIQKDHSVKLEDIIERLEKDGIKLKEEN